MANNHAKWEKEEKEFDRQRKEADKTLCQPNEKLIELLKEKSRLVAKAREAGGSCIVNSFFIG